jgi:hypothetical protein
MYTQNTNTQNTNTQNQNIIQHWPLRACAIALMIAGILFSSFMFFHPANNPEGALKPIWTPVHVAWVSAYLLILLSFVPLYPRLEIHPNRLTMIGYFLSFAGVALSLPIAVWDAFIVPYLACHAPTMILDIEEISPEASVVVFRGIFFLTVLLFSVGFMLFGMAGGQSRFFSGLAGTCLAVGAPLFWIGAIVVSKTALGNTVTILGAVLFGLGLIQVGIARML